MPLVSPDNGFIRNSRNLFSVFLGSGDVFKVVSQKHENKYENTWYK